MMRRGSQKYSRYLLLGGGLTSWTGLEACEMVKATKNDESVPGIKFVPTSITTAPGLIHEPCTNSGLPMAEMRISAVLT